MGLLRVLERSFSLLGKEPKIFLPRIFTTSLYSIFVLYSAWLSLKISVALQQEMGTSSAIGATPGLARIQAQFADLLLIFALFFLVVYVVDILSYGMYVRIVEDYYSKGRVSILRALKDTFGMSRTLFIFGIIALVFLAVFLAFYGILAFIFIHTGRVIYSILALTVICIGIVAFAVLFFFSIPVIMLEKKGILKALSKSFELGIKYKGPVIKTNFLFVGLMALSILVAMLTNFRGGVAITAVVVFIFGRLSQVVVYTYISVINPSIYIYYVRNGSNLALNSRKKS